MPRSLPRLPLAIGFLLAAALPALAQGTPRSINECERLKNDLAYNQCLSMFRARGPNVAGGYAAGELPTTPAAPANLQAEGANALAATPLAIPQAEEPAVETRRGRRRYGRHGRQAAVFTVGGESRGRRRRR